MPKNPIKKYNDPLSVEQLEAKDLINKSDITILEGEAGCVDSKTEFFNGTTWKPISEYKNGDKVLQYNKDGTTSLVLPYKYIKKETHGLIEFTRGKQNQVLSPDHRFIYLTSKGNIAEKQFKDVLEVHEKSKRGFYGKIIKTFNTFGKGLEINENLIRVLIMIQADGALKSNSKGQLVTMNLLKYRKIVRCESLLNLVKIDFKKYQMSSGYTRFVFYLEDAFKEFPEEWYSMDNKQFRIIQDEIFRWDGNISGNRKSYYTTIKKNADFIQFVCSSNGKGSNISIDNRPNKLLCYEVNCTSKRAYGSMTTHSTGVDTITIKPYTNHNGYEYCFTVNSGMLVLRRNNSIFITGNCGKTFTAICYALEKISIDKRSKIFITRATAFKKSHNNGFIPGDLFEKYDPWLRPIYDNMEKFVSKETLTKYKTDGTVEIVPLMYIQGRTLDHSTIIVDEAQNLDDEEVKMIFTRLGKKSKLIFCGDLEQKIIERGSGIEKLKYFVPKVKGLNSFRLTQNFRNPIIKELLDLYKVKNELPF